MESSVMIGYGILGLAITAAGFIPSLLAMYKKNNNASKIYQFNAIGILVPGIIGLVLSLVFGVPNTQNSVWLLVVLIVLEVLRLAIWGYLMYLVIKDKEI